MAFGGKNMAKLLNKAETNGMFDGVYVDNYTELSVELSALDITKTADKKIWVKDQLEYTITVTNIDDSVPGLPVEDVEVTDTIDPTIAKLIETSLTLVIDGTPITPVNYNYNTTTGLLTVNVGNLNAKGKAIITFQVEMV